jgi:hypothetical protein
VAGVADDLAWWRSHRDAAQKDPAAMRDLLDRLKAWKAQHDADRAGHPPPFLRMAWDGVFGDEDARVTAAIAELEAALAEA